MAFPIPALFVGLPQLTTAAVIDILLLALVIYQILQMLKGTRAVQVLLGMLLLAGLYYGASLGRLQTLHWLLVQSFPYLAIAVIVLFQAEIRSGLARIGRNPFSLRISALEARQNFEDILMAVGHFSSHKIGALMVLERETGLRTYTESGIPLRAKLSYDLLVAIFQPGAPLHDGAVIIRKDKIVAAACFLPLSVSPILETGLGTRHRAAIGVTEETDAVAIVVSEETAGISLAIRGAIELDLSPERLTHRLSEIFEQPLPPPSLTIPRHGPPPEPSREMLREDLARQEKR